MPEYIIILHMYTINDNHMMYGSWNMGHDRQIFLLFWTILWFSIPLTIQKIQFWKHEKTPGDIIILHMCAINDNHMMSDSWNMECDGQNFLSFWTIFCPFILQITWKIQILKNGEKKMPGDITTYYIYYLHKCTKNHDHMLYCSWDMYCAWCM